MLNLKILKDIKINLLHIYIFIISNIYLITNILYISNPHTVNNIMTVSFSKKSNKHQFFILLLKFVGRYEIFCVLFKLFIYVSFKLLIIFNCIKEFNIIFLNIMELLLFKIFN